SRRLSWPRTSAESGRLHRAWHADPVAAPRQEPPLATYIPPYKISWMPAQEPNRRLCRARPLLGRARESVRCRCRGRDLRSDTVISRRCMMLKPIEFWGPFTRAERRPWFADANGANLAAGMTAGLFYAFGAIPVHLDAMASLGLSSRAAVSWFFITFMTSAVGSLFLTLRYRLPIPIGWSIPALVFLVGAGNRYSHAEMAGACLVAGIMIVAIG